MLKGLNKQTVGTLSASQKNGRSTEVSELQRNYQLPALMIA